MRGRPSAVVCAACGGQFFIASLPIHQKTCFQRNAFTDIPCPECRSLIRSGKYHDHVAQCHGRRYNTADQRQGDAMAHRDEPEEPVNEPEADGRVRCRRCDRAFHADRIAKHQSVCVGTRRVIRVPRGSVEQLRKSAASPVVKVHLRPSRHAETSSVRTNAIHRAFMSFSLPESHSSHTWGRDTASDKRYDLVHRDYARKPDDSWGMSSSGRLNLSTSMASSAGNPLATSRLMTLRY